MSQYFCHAEKIIDVPPESFDPAPKVMSAVVRLRPHAANEKAQNEEHFAAFVQAAFAQKRKTLRNNLKTGYPLDALEASDIDLGRRAETLSLEEFVQLSNLLAIDR